MCYLAGIDIGSNTSLIAVAKQSSEGPTLCYEHLYYTRLSEGLDAHLHLTNQALNRLDRAFYSMRQVLDKWQVTKVLAVATSACRQAKNQTKLFDLAKKYQLKLDIISSKKEAELSFKAASLDYDLSIQKILVVDIGGGSTEFSDGQNSYSLKMGCVSLTKQFLKTSTSCSNRKNLVQYIQHQLQALTTFLNQKNQTVVFVAGTPISLAFLEKQTTNPKHIHKLILKKERILYWLETLINTDNKSNMPYLPKHHANVIVAGVTLMYEILKKTNKTSLMVSQAGIRHALILEQLKIQKPKINFNF